jgi:hypothetical protein
MNATLRRVLVVGHIYPRIPVPCGQDSHVGPLLNRQKYIDFALQNEGCLFWADFGDCAACSSTIHSKQMRQP